jgi:hypothetical protein
MTYEVSYEDPVVNRLLFQKDYSFLAPVTSSLASDVLEEIEVADEQTVAGVKRDLEGLKIEGNIASFVQRFVTVNRKPLSLKGREYLRWIYNAREKYPKGSRDIVIVSGRQVEKSTTIAAKVMTLCALYPSFSALVIEPRVDQIKVISQQRFDPMAQDSEALQEAWLSSKNVWQVGMKGFNNGSMVNFKSCYYSADPSRGITAGFLAIDELQDIISDNIPILEECQSHLQLEPDKIFNLYTGTPKTTSNTLNQHWSDTCQFEWLVECQSCRHYNYLDDKVIGKRFYICSKCGKQIYPTQHGQWIAMKPSLIDTRWGFRISQLMVPFMSHANVLKKMENPNIPRRVFNNEVLGLSFDEGQLLLTEADVLSRCEPRPMDSAASIKERKVFICGGVDHGTGDYAVSGMEDSAARGMKARKQKPSFT